MRRRIATPRQCAILLMACLALGVGSEAIAQDNFAGDQEPSPEITSGKGAEPSPFGPLLGIFSHLRLSLSAQGGYDDNVNLSDEGDGSLFTSLHGSLSYDLTNDRTAIRLNLDSGVTYYFDVEGNDEDFTPSFVLSFTHSFSTRLQVAANFSAAYRSEPDFSRNVGPEDLRSDYFLANGGLSASYNWTHRLSTVTSFSFSRLQYDDPDVGLFQDRTDITLGNQFRYSLVDRTSFIVGEYRFGIVDYDEWPLDSQTHYLLGGVDHNFGPRLHLTARAGASFRCYSAQEDSVEPHFESALSYSGAHRSVFSWTTRFGVEEPGSMDATSRTTFRTGLNMTYAVTARIGSTVAVNYFHSESDDSLGGMGGNSSEDGIDALLGLRYSLHPRITLNLDYQHIQLSSGGGGRDYSRNRYSGGVTVTF